MSDSVARLNAVRYRRKVALKLVKLFRRSRGLTLIGLWAFAPPVVVQSDGKGGFEVSIGAGAGQYEVVRRSCYGGFVSSRPVPVRTGGVLLEFEPSAYPFRVAGFGGATSVSGEPSDQGGLYAGALVAYEGGWIGLGAGFVLIPGNQTVPSLYLRFGDREGGFFQSDLFAPSPFLGATGLLRTGVGFRGDRTSGFLGFSTGRALEWGEGNWDKGGAFGELKFPLSGSLDALIAASWFPGEEHSDWGAGIGLSYRPRE